MLLVSAENLSKSYPGKVCFNNAGFQVHSDIKIGFIGRNGTGKTSLFKVLAGEEDYNGTLVIPKNIKILKLDQDPVYDGNLSVREVLFEHLAEIAELEHAIFQIHHKLAKPDLADEQQQDLLKQLESLDHKFELMNGHDIERRAVAILDGLGFPEERIDESVSNLSGGELNRLSLAILLNQDADLWLFDEPTNHLDITGIEFLEKFLGATEKGFIIISHDRRFLDKCTTHTWELENEKITVYNMPYSQYLLEKTIRRKAELGSFQKQQIYIKKEEDFITKYGAGQRAKQARGRSKRLARIEKIDNPFFKDCLLKLNLPPCPDYGNKILNLEKLSFSYEKELLLENITFEINPGETFAVVGPNGCGKSTLFKLLTENLSGFTGSFAWGQSVKKNYLEQNDTVGDEANTPLGFMRSITSHVTEQELRDTLASLLFFNDSANNPISTLSGGEKKKLLMAKLLYSASNLLLLDEPTNHLDIESREAVENALSAFDGTLLVVSHDRYFLDRIADRVLWLEKDYSKITEGGYSEAEKAYREYKSAVVTEKKAVKAKIKTVKHAAKGPFARLKTSELEERIIKNEELLANLNEKFALPEYYQSEEKIKKLHIEADQLKSELSELEEEYLTRNC
ncbi:MAG: ABC-F family ATP-binding cassette domain-containing protein [Planctomycetota bacterium]|jgi:ATP-binding cassette subfamily F protein 3